MEEEKTLYQKAHNKPHNIPCNRDRSLQLVVYSSTLPDYAGCLFNILKNKMCFFILGGFFKFKPPLKCISNPLTLNTEERPATVLPPQYTLSSAPYSLPQKYIVRKRHSNLYGPLTSMGFGFLEPFTFVF